MIQWLHNTVAVLSVIEGLGDSVCAYAKALPSNPSVFLPEKSFIHKLVNNEECVTNIDERLQTAEFFIADPHLFAKILPHCSISNIKWIHSTWAGPDKLIRLMKETYPDLECSKFPLLTRSAPTTSPMGWDLAEWVIGQIIAKERNFMQSYEDQKQKCWNPEPVLKYRSLRDLTIGVMGIGSIGSCIVQVARNMNIKVFGLCRSVESAHKGCTTEKLYITKELPEFLSACDYVVNALPSTNATRSLLEGSMFKNCKSGCIFMNVGRGDICSESSILQALDNCWISGAVLDVLPREPLPAESLLWKHPGVTITPHVGGISIPSTVMDSFIEEHERISQGEAPRTAVNWNEEY